MSGAGDTVVAVLAAMLAMRADYESAMRAANAAAAVVVGKRGTATVSAAELRQRILPAATLAAEEKIVFDWSELDEQARRLAQAGPAHRLHQWLFRYPASRPRQAAGAGARAACDRLVLGLNSDASVSRLKGPDRPVQKVQARAEVLAALEAVDLVVVFDEDTPRESDRDRSSRRVLIKGADYTRDQVVGHDIVEALGGEVLLIELVPGHSTSDIVERCRAPKRAETERVALASAVFKPEFEVPCREFFGNATRLFRRGRRQRSAEALADLASGAGRLDRHSGRAVAGACGRVARQPHGQGVRGRLLLAGRCRADAAAARGGAVVVVRPRALAPGAAPEAVIEVKVETLDSVLEEAGAHPGFDLMSIDVEGHELEVLSGFDFARWQPRLILLEDHVADLSKHRYLNSVGYRMIRRYENNGWYVPRGSMDKASLADRWEILRKYYLALPFRWLRNLSRRVRKGQG